MSELSNAGLASNRRRTRVINRAFQWKYAMTVALTVFLVSSIISAVLYGVLHHQARMRMMYPDVYTAEVALVILLFAVGFAAVAAGGVAIWSVFVTHRICGPLFVLDRYFGEMAGGRLPAVRPLRKRDEFKELMASFTQAVDSIREEKKFELQVLDEVAQLAAAAPDDAAGQKQALQTVAAKVETLARRTRAYLGEDDSAALPPAGPPEHSESSPRSNNLASSTSLP